MSDTTCAQGCVDDLLKKTAKGTMMSFGGFVFGRLTNFLLYILVSRFYGPASLGMFMTAMLFLQISQCIATFGFKKGAMRYMAIAHERHDYQMLKKTIVVSFFFPAITSIISTILFYISVPGFAVRYLHSVDTGIVLKYFICSLFSISMMGIASEMTRAFKDVRLAVLVEEIMFPLLMLFFSIILHLAGCGFIYIALALFCATTLSASAGVCFVCMETKRFAGRIGPLLQLFKDSFRSGYFKELAGFSFPFAFAGMIVLGYHSADIFMLNIFSTSHNVGIYSAAARISMLLSSLMLCCGQILSPLVAGEFGAIGRESKVGMLYKVVARWMYCIAFPCFVFVLMTPDSLLSLFGSEYTHAAAPVLVVLSLSQVYYSVSGVAAVVLGMTGHQYKEMWLMTGAFIFNVTLNYLLIPRMGIMGAAVATMISGLIFDSLRLLIVYIIRREHFLHWGYLPGIVLCGVLYWLRGIVPCEIIDCALFRLGYGVFAAVVVAICVLFTTMTSEDRDILRRFFPARLRRRNIGTGNPSERIEL